VLKKRHCEAAQRNEAFLAAHIQAAASGVRAELRLGSAPF